MDKQHIRIEKGMVTGYTIDLGNSPLLVIKAKKGYIMCGYLNIQTANMLGDIAGKVTGVRTIQDMLKQTIVEASEKAQQAGLRTAMNARTFLNELL